jgi:hypothetical protein
MLLLQKERRSLYSSTMTNPADDLLQISMSHGLPRCLMRWQNSVLRMP